MNLNLKTPIQLKGRNTAFYIQVNSVEVPFSFYGLSSDIATLNVSFTNGVNTKESFISLTPANYNSNSVLQELKSKLITEAGISSGSYIGFTPDLNFSYSSSTGKSSYVMSNVDCEIILKFSENQNLGIFFGFNTNVIISPLVITSDNVCVANPITSLYVRSPTFKQGNNREFIVINDDYCDIIRQVPILTGQNTYICDYQDSDLIYITNNEINEMNIYLTNNLTYIPVDLKGLNWSISLTILEIVIPKFEPFVKIDSLIGLRNEGQQDPILSKEEQERLNMLEKQKEEIITKLDKYKNVFEDRLKGDMGYLDKLIEKKKTRTNVPSKNISTI